jgi:hypothetical protein
MFSLRRIIIYNTDYSLWKSTRHMMRSRAQISPIREEDGTWARSEQQKVEIYNLNMYLHRTPLTLNSAFCKANRLMQHAKKLNIFLR